MKLFSLGPFPKEGEGGKINKTLPRQMEEKGGGGGNGWWWGLP